VRKLSPAADDPRARGVHIVAEVARTGVGGVAQNRSGARRIGSELLRAFGPGPAGQEQGGAWQQQQPA